MESCGGFHEDKTIETIKWILRWESLKEQVLRTEVESHLHNLNSVSPPHIPTLKYHSLLSWNILDFTGKEISKIVKSEPQALSENTSNGNMWRDYFEHFHLAPTPPHALPKVSLVPTLFFLAFSKSSKLYPIRLVKIEIFLKWHRLSSTSKKELYAGHFVFRIGFGSTFNKPPKLLLLIQF